MQTVRLDFLRAQFFALLLGLNLSLKSDSDASPAFQRL
jgi:hypothetical protein